MLGFWPREMLPQALKLKADEALHVADGVKVVP